MNNNKAVDVGQIIDSSPTNSYQIWLITLTAAAFMVDGLANQVIGIAIPALSADWGIPEENFSWVVALGLTGLCFGSLFGGFLGDNIGRRRGLIGSMTLFGVATVATAFAPNIETLIAIRFIDGLGIGAAIPNGAALVSEYLPERRRGRGIALSMVFIPVGGMVAGTISSFVLPDYGWRAYFFVAGVLPVAATLLFLGVLPESPRFLQRRPERKQELVRLMGRFGHQFNSDVSFADPVIEKQHTRFSALFGNTMLVETLAIWGAFFFCLMASYTMFSWIPTLLATLEFHPMVTGFGMTAFHGGGIVGGVACGFLIERLGSRGTLFVLVGGGIIAALSLAAVLAMPEPSAILLMPLFITEGLFLAGIHTIVYALAANSYPPVVKATGVGAAATVGRIGAILSSFTGVLILKLTGSTGYFISISLLLGICLICGLIVKNHIPKNEGSRSGGVKDTDSSELEKEAALESA